MTTMIKRLAFSSLALMALGTTAIAAPKTYQVTGPVLEVSPTSVTVQKGKEKWLLERDASTKASGDVKVGDKVTIEYRMVATTIESKGAAPAGKAAAAAPAPAAAAPAAPAAKPAK
ncbi:MAG: hypothetical protein ABUR63_07340 [Verrucomicrobiota bacterium]